MYHVSLKSRAENEKVALPFSQILHRTTQLEYQF
jgi:hypothetical protein